MRRTFPLIAYFLAALAMLVIMMWGVEVAPELKIPAAVASIIGIGLFSIVGLFDRSFIRYAIYSAIIQFGYFTLDVSTALLIGKSVWFAIIQFINFAVAGLLFALIASLLYNAVRKERMPDYAGMYENNQWLVLALAISCLALGGMPGFNIFVGEFIIYSTLFTVHPALTLAAVFASLVCFIFYFRICYVMFAGKAEETIKLGFLPKAVISLLAMLIIVLGLVPQILFTVLEMVA
jgi:formate hydrogenlyase subunit 3/multisubunit Na+/H+ antiporter MnhD subunit